MRTLQLNLENQDFDRLAAAAGASAKSVEEVAIGAILSWVRVREKELQEGAEALKRRYVTLRLKDKDRAIPSIAEELGVRPEVATGWDREIRTVSAEWGKAFASASKSVDPLTWEMTVRERFYDLWGHRP